MSSGVLRLQSSWRTILGGLAEPSVLTVQHDLDGLPVHVVWALPAEERRPAVLVTAYRPDTTLWDSEYRQRKKR